MNCKKNELKNCRFNRQPLIGGIFNHQKFNFQCWWIFCASLQSLTINTYFYQCIFEMTGI
jgi:hypothetical protein